MTEQQQEIIRGQIAAKLTEAGIDDYEITDIEDGKTAETSSLSLHVRTDGKSFPGSICTHANQLTSQVITLLKLSDVEMQPLEQATETDWILPFAAQYTVTVAVPVPDPA